MARPKNPRLTCLLCSKPRLQGKMSLCSLHTRRRRAAGMEVPEFVAAWQRGENPGVPRKLCVHCGEPFLAHCGHVKSCSDRCRRAYNVTKTKRWYSERPQKDQERRERQRLAAREQRKRFPERFKAREDKRRASRWVRRRCRICGQSLAGTRCVYYCKTHAVAGREAYRAGRNTASKLSEHLSLATIALLNGNLEQRPGKYFLTCCICGKEFRHKHWRKRICADPECQRKRTSNRNKLNKRKRKARNR